MNWFSPVWPVPNNVRSLVTTRSAGNLATHVGDVDDAIANRKTLLSQAQVPHEPRFMAQVHGNCVIDIDMDVPRDNSTLEADGATTTTAGLPLVVMVADCLPILLGNTRGDRIGVAHAGWRGLASGVIANALSHFDSKDDVIAWLGPGIGPCHYEVDDAVRERFDSETGFAMRSEGHYAMNLYTIATQQLNEGGVTHIYGGDFCTWCDPRFFSHRENQAQARFAAMIWIEGDEAG